MNITIIGTGNVAHHLAKRLKETGHPPKAIAGTTSAKGQQFVRELNLTARVVTDTDLSGDEMDFVIISVPDGEIRPVAQKYAFSAHSIVLHTSGAQPMELLNGKNAHYGVLYPFQTFSKNKKVNFSRIPVLIEGNSSDTEQKIAGLASLLSPDVKSITSEQRLKIHLAAVFACNFTNNLYAIAESILKEANLELQDLEHLIRETVDKAMDISPKKAQTGPAIRRDTEVLKKHLETLSDEDLRQLYKLHTRLIQRSK